MTTRIPEQRLGELEVWGGDFGIAVAPCLAELRTLIATARRERVLAEQVKVLAAECEAARKREQICDPAKYDMAWARDVYPMTKVTDAMLATHNTTLAKLAEGGE